MLVYGINYSSQVEEKKEVIKNFARVRSLIAGGAPEPL
jgi:hypothetical protein